MAAKSKAAKTVSSQSRRCRLSTSRRPKLSHYDAAGRATMVDVSAKPPTLAHGRGQRTGDHEPEGSGRPARQSQG